MASAERATYFALLTNPLRAGKREFAFCWTLPCVSSSARFDRTIRREGAAACMLAGDRVEPGEPPHSIREQLAVPIHRAVEALRRPPRS